MSMNRLVFFAYPAYALLSSSVSLDILSGDPAAICTQNKGTETVSLGYFCYKWYPFIKGELFFLHNHVYEIVAVHRG